VGDLGCAPVVVLLGCHGRHSVAGFKSEGQCIRQFEEIAVEGGMGRSMFAFPSEKNLATKKSELIDKLLWLNGGACNRGW
jgi:hypothetical protein